MTDMESMLRDAAAEVGRAVSTVAPRGFEARARGGRPAVALTAITLGVAVVLGGVLVLRRDAGPTPADLPAPTVASAPPETDTTDLGSESTHLVIDPPPPGTAGRTEYGPSEDSVRIYAQPRPDPENGPWMVVGWSPGSFGGTPEIGDGSNPDRQYFDAGRGYVLSLGIDPSAVRDLIGGAIVEPGGRRTIDPAALPDDLELIFDGDWVSDVGLRDSASAASEVSWRPDPTGSRFVRLLVTDDPDMTAWRAGRVPSYGGAGAVAETTVADHPAYHRSAPGAQVLVWHDGSRTLQLVASATSYDDLAAYAADVRPAGVDEWTGIDTLSYDAPTTDEEQATVGPAGSATTPIVEATTIGTVTIPDGTGLSIAVAAYGTLILSRSDGFVIHAVGVGSTGAVGTPGRVTSEISPEAADGDLVFGIVVAGSSVALHDDATSEEIPVALTTEAQPVHGFVGFAARLPTTTTYATLSITDPATGLTEEVHVGY